VPAEEMAASGAALLQRARRAGVGGCRHRGTRRGFGRRGELDRLRSLLQECARVRYPARDGRRPGSAAAVGGGGAVHGAPLLDGVGTRGGVRETTEFGRGFFLVVWHRWGLGKG
jgi:hypothetical protein